MPRRGESLCCQMKVTEGGIYIHTYIDTYITLHYITLHTDTHAGGTMFYFHFIFTLSISLLSIRLLSIFPPLAYRSPKLII